MTSQLATSSVGVVRRRVGGGGRRRLRGLDAAARRKLQGTVDDQRPGRRPAPALRSTLTSRESQTVRCACLGARDGRCRSSGRHSGGRRATGQYRTWGPLTPPTRCRPGPAQPRTVGASQPTQRRSRTITATRWRVVTTSTGGATTDPPTSTTSPCCAGHATPTSTTAAPPSPDNPTGATPPNTGRRPDPPRRRRPGDIPHDPTPSGRRPGDAVARRHPTPEVLRRRGREPGRWQPRDQPAPAGQQTGRPVAAPRSAGGAVLPSVPGRPGSNALMNARVAGVSRRQVCSTSSAATSGSSTAVRCAATSGRSPSQ